MITEQRYEYSFVCLLCGRDAAPDPHQPFRLMLDQAAMMKPTRCSACRGNVLLTRSDVGHLGSSIDPRVPTRLDTRPGYKAGRSA